MDTNVHPKKQKDEIKPPWSEDSLLITLTETVQELEGVKCCRDHHREREAGRSEGTMFSPAEEEEEDERRGRRVDEEQEEKECKQKALEVLRELSVFHSCRLAAWREALRKCAFMLNKSPPEGSDQQHPSTTDVTGCKVRPCSDSFSDTFLSVGDDIENILEKLSTILAKLDAEDLQLSYYYEAPTVGAAFQEPRETSVQPEDVNNHLNSHAGLESDSGYKEEVEDGADRRRREQTPDAKFNTSDRKNVEETGEESQAKGQVSEKLIHCPTDLMEETERDQERTHDKGKEEIKSEWITVGLTGQLQEDRHADVPDACFIRAPAGAADGLRCEVADDLSCLMVTGSEELVSRVIRVKVQDGTTFHFPVTVVVPFRARHRGSYRDVAVKVVDGKRRASYITPVTTEGVYGGQKGSFAEVKVYSLGLFAVVSCIKRESYTVPRRGLSLKLSMDPRICLNYLPGSFTAPIMAQSTIQPLDAVLLAAVKSRKDVYHSVVSTSPLLDLTHPTSQPLRRPLTVTLPCPPNLEKKRRTRGEPENQDLQTGPVSASSAWDHSVTNRVRILSVPVKSKEMSNEALILLGSRDKQWSVLDQVAVRNQQNGLVSFELTENWDRLLVVRLLSPLQPGHLTSLAEELEDSVCRHTVAVVLQRRHGEPHGVLVAAVPSRDLGWELSRLQAEGSGGLVETSSEISMREADQLLLRFTGNITSTGGASTKVGAQDDENEALHERLTFHGQRKNQLLLRLTEVDPFGNHSSPHYKGTLLFYKVTRGQLEWRGDKAVPKDTKLLGNPVCKLSLTLPKKVRNIIRPFTARVKLCEETDPLADSLLLWLSGELSEEELALLVLSLRLCRSTAQLVKLRAGHSLSSRAFHVLAVWRRGQPAVPHQPKASQLAHCLAKSGRPDLARELLLRQAAATRQSSLKEERSQS
ncbi:death domain-containing protein 1 [Embiotoca jacksoni]|uniref:death domain-containing protein 1 n=1 Tax=Embiotoca jacksoni TaxID=100190 RepID=UPI0037047837